MTSVQTPAQLTPFDGSFLRLESSHAHMHVGFSAIFARPDRGPRPTIEALREQVATRLGGVPWCRWRLQEAPLGLSEPRWVEDPDFNLDAHVIGLTGPHADVSRESFEALRDTVMSAPLDRSRPLWQLCLVPRLDDGRIGLVGKVHHSLVDGFAALGLVGLILDEQPDAVPQAPEPQWRPDRPSGTVDWAVSGLVRTAGDALGVVRGAAEAATRPATTFRNVVGGVGDVVQAVREDFLPASPRSPLNVPIGSRRTLATHRATRDQVRAARSGGGTINDIGLTVVAGALRELALRRGEPPVAPLKAMIPVSMRNAGDDEPGNRITMVYIGLPVHLASPEHRRQEVRMQTRRIKESGRQFGTQTIFRMAGLLPAPVRSPVVRALASPRVFNLTVSQSPAPRGSMHFMGCELEEPYSVVPIADGHALAIGMVRYDQELFFGCYGDPDALPEIGELPALLEAEVSALASAPREEGSVQANGGEPVAAAGSQS